jgi:hypothetical protein
MTTMNTLFFGALIVMLVVVLLLSATVLLSGRLPIRKVRKTAQPTEEQVPTSMTEAEQFDYLERPPETQTPENEDHSRRLPRVTQRDITDAKEREWRGASSTGLAPGTDSSPMYLPQNDGEWKIREDDHPDPEGKVIFGD